MGTIRQGALGGFYGKAGSIIGSSWRDINYIKGCLSQDPGTKISTGRTHGFSVQPGNW